MKTPTLDVRKAVHVCGRNFGYIPLVPPVSLKAIRDLTMPKTSTVSSVCTFPVLASGRSNSRIFPLETTISCILVPTETKNITFQYVSYKGLRAIQPGRESDSWEARIHPEQTHLRSFHGWHGWCRWRAAEWCCTETWLLLCGFRTQAYSGAAKWALGPAQNCNDHNNSAWALRNQEASS